MKQGAASEPLGSGGGGGIADIALRFSLVVAFLSFSLTCLITWRAGASTSYILSRALKAGVLTFATTFFSWLLGRGLFAPGSKGGQQ